MLAACLVASAQAGPWVRAYTDHVDSSVSLYGVDFSRERSGKALLVGQEGTLLQGMQIFLVKAAKASILGWMPRESGTLRNLYGTHAGIAVGADGAIVRKDSSHAAWVAVASGDTNTLNAVYSPDGGRTAWAVGHNGTILKSSDTGATWTRQVSGTVQHLQAVHFVNANLGWAVGQAATVLKTTNGGGTWVVQPAPSSSEFYGVRFLDSSTGFVVGSSGRIHRTHNGGSSWDSPASGTTEVLYAVHFATDTLPGGGSRVIGCAVGRSGIITCTENAGGTWNVETTPTTRTLTSVYLFGGAYGKQAVAVGSGGTILVRDEVTGSVRGGPGERAGERVWIAGGVASFHLPRPMTVGIEVSGLDGRLLWKFRMDARAGLQAVRLPATLPTGLVMLDVRTEGTPVARGVGLIDAR